MTGNSANWVLNDKPNSLYALPDILPVTGLEGCDIHIYYHAKGYDTCMENCYKHLREKVI